MASSQPWDEATVAFGMYAPHLVAVTLAFILAAADPPDDVGAPDRYAKSAAAQRARNKAVMVADRDRGWAERLRSSVTVEAHNAFHAIVDEYGDRLIRFAYGLVKSTDAAHDIVQDVLLRVWERRETIQPEKSFRAYLFTAVRRAALDVLKRRTVELRYASNAVHDDPPCVSPVDDQFDVDAIADAVRTALAKLPERRRTALHLRYEEQLPFVVVAEVMGLSENAAQHLVKRAVDELRGYLEL